VIASQAIIAFGATECHANYVMKCDDDSYVQVAKMVTKLQQLAKISMYMGLISYNELPKRELASKWYGRACASQQLTNVLIKVHVACGFCRRYVPSVCPWYARVILSRNQCWC
jgi:hypothetical protein